MTELFLKIVDMSISAGWLVLAVLILRLVLKKAPRGIHVVLWGIVAVRLICPFYAESDFSLIPRQNMLSEAMVSSSGNALSTGITAASDSYAGNNSAVGLSFGVDHGGSFLTVLSIIWLAGMAVLAVYAIISCLRIRRQVDTAVRLRGNLFQSEKVGTPFVFGWIRPMIYLPFHMKEQDLEYVAAHEQAHIRRKDQWWKLLGFCLLTIYWFHPLMWVAYVLLGRDIEFACDESVIRRLNSEQKADYMQALVNCSVKRRRVSACPLAFGEAGVKERVKTVMNYKKPAFWVMILAGAACIFLIVCFLTNPKQDQVMLKITVPAGSQEQYVFAEEMICPEDDQIVVTYPKGQQDTEVCLKLTENGKETIYDTSYLTAGMSAKLQAQKGEWFQIGIKVQNHEDQVKTVYLNVKNAVAGISEKDTSEENALEKYKTDYIGDAPKVSAIAHGLPYPDGVKCDSIELKTQKQPYELIVYLKADDSVSDSDLKSCADLAFDLIGNMDIITFKERATDRTFASYTRSADSVS